MTSSPFVPWENRNAILQLLCYPLSTSPTVTIGLIGTHNKINANNKRTAGMCMESLGMGKTWTSVELGLGNLNWWALGECLPPK